MTALATFFLNAQASTSQQRARQTATQLAVTAVDNLRGLQPSNLVIGRSKADADSQFATAPSTVAPWLISMTAAWDDDPANTNVTIPTTADKQTISNNALDPIRQIGIDYTIRTYLGWCDVNLASPDCKQPQDVALPKVRYLRAVVAVSWTDKKCAQSTCAYVTATLVSTVGDPEFNLKQEPPAPPKVSQPAAQRSVAGEDVRFQLGVLDDTGVPPFTWDITAGGLPDPDRLTLARDGVISGKPTVPGSRSLTVTVTDAFLRTHTSELFAWTVLPPLTAAQTNQNATKDIPITTLTMTASGGYPPYTWSDQKATLPPGLTLDPVRGQIVGTPTRAGRFDVELTVRDSDRSVVRTVVVKFIWDVAYQPLAVNPATLSQSSPVNRAITPTIQLTTTGGSGAFVWSGEGLPTGLSLTADGLISGTPTAPGTFAGTLTVTDATAGLTKQVPFTWTILGNPTVNAPDNQYTRPGAVVSLQLATTCPSGPCTYTLGSGPTGLSVSATGRITGTITSTAQAFGNVTVTVRDRFGVTATTAPFRWVVSTYTAAVSATNGLLSYWRLGEPTALLIATDSFTGTSASSLTSHAPEIGGGWSTEASSVLANARISTADRAYRLGTGYSINYLSATPSGTSYTVEADLTPLSIIPGDMAGVVARMATASVNTFYLVRWEQTSATAGSWNVIRHANSTATKLQTIAAPSLTVGTPYRIGLRVTTISSTASTLELYVDGVRIFSPFTDTTSTLRTAGKAGIMDGTIGGSVSKSDTTGLHLDNFQVTPSGYPRAVDSKGTNTGDYDNGVVLGQAGALTGDTNLAVRLDGVNDYVQVFAPTGPPVGAAARSVELWFKTTGTGRQVLFDYGTRDLNAKFALWIDPGGGSMTAWGYGGGSDKTFVLPAAVNNGAWHHVVKTYDGANITLYIDGVALPAQSATRATALDAYGVAIGTVLTPGDANSAGFFAGAIDEVAVYTTVLGQADVAARYELGSP